MTILKDLAAIWLHDKVIAGRMPGCDGAWSHQARKSAMVADFIKSVPKQHRVSERGMAVVLFSYLQNSPIGPLADYRLSAYQPGSEWGTLFCTIPPLDECRRRLGL